MPGNSTNMRAATVVSAPATAPIPRIHALTRPSLPTHVFAPGSLAVACCSSSVGGGNDEFRGLKVAVPTVFPLLLRTWHKITKMSMCGPIVPFGFFAGFRGPLGPRPSRILGFSTLASVRPVTASATTIRDDFDLPSTSASRIPVVVPNTAQESSTASTRRQVISRAGARSGLGASKPGQLLFADPTGPASVDSPPSKPARG